MKRFLIFLISIVSLTESISPCTSAIVSGTLTKSGRPLLWKHRDTGEQDNKVERIIPKNGGFEYIAIFNASDKNCKEAWIGMNIHGFAIMNTASYNLKDDDVKEMDKEGVIMSEALSECKTINDFESFLLKHRKPLRVEANFGVIDASGEGAYFEVNNTTYKRFNLKDEPEGIIIRTNYSKSGRNNEGYGFVRENNARHLLNKYIKSQNIEPYVFTEILSRSYYHSLLDIDFVTNDSEWAIDQDFIPRYISSATCVIEGVQNGESPSLTTMWVGLGYPPCSEIRAAWTGENGIPQELRGTLENGHSVLCDESLNRREDVFPIKKGNGKKYIKMTTLYNNVGTGFCQKLIPINMEYYDKIYKELDLRRRKNK